MVFESVNELAPKGVIILNPGYQIGRFSTGVQNILLSFGGGKTFKKDFYEVKNYTQNQVLNAVNLCL